MKDETQHNLWTKFLEEYNEYFIPDDEKWFQKFEELKSFIDTNKKRPSSTSKNIDEKKLGVFRSRQSLL